MKKKVIVILMGIYIVMGFMSCEVLEDIVDALSYTPSSSYSYSDSSYSSSSSSNSSSSSSYSIKDGIYYSTKGMSGYIEISGSSFTWYMYEGYEMSGSVYINGDRIKLGSVLSAGYIYSSEKFTTGENTWVWASY